MLRQRSQRPVVRRPVAPPTKFVPQIVTLEDRTVPSTFYVDPTWAGKGNLTQQDFNVGYPGTKTGVLFVTSVANYNAAKVANPDASFGFSDLRQAIDASEANPGPDTIRVARSTTPIPLDNSTFVQVPGQPAGTTFNSIVITQPLDIVGSGVGATVIAPSKDTQLDTGGGPAADPAVAVVRIGSAASPNANVNVFDLTFDGTGRQLGTAFQVRDSAVANFDRVQVENVTFPGQGAVAIVGNGATSLTVRDSQISGYDRTGVQFLSTNGGVFNTTITGPGGTVLTNGVEVADNSKVTVSGSTLVGNTGPGGSNGIVVSGAAGKVPILTAFGNTITGNAFGITVGIAAGDPATATVNRNNIYGNNVGIDATFAAATVDATANFWGSNLGAFTPGSDATKLFGNPVTGKVNAGSFLAALTPVIARPTLSQYLSAAGVASTPATPVVPTEQATFWVDPAFAGQVPDINGNVVFNKGYPGQENVPLAKAFTDLAAAIIAAEANPGPDVIRVAQSANPIPVSNTTFTPIPNNVTATFNSITITQPLDIIGSGTGATILAPQADTQSDADGAGPGAPAADERVALFRISSTVNVFNLTLDGAGKQLGAAFQVRDGANATFAGVQVENVRFPTTGAGGGTGAVAIVGLNNGAGTSLNISNSLIHGYDRTGVQFLSTNGTVIDTAITGPGGTTPTNGIEIGDNSTVTVTGSTLTGNTARGGSNGVIASGAAGTTPVLTAFGNEIIGNEFGITVGSAAGDPATAKVNWNNISGNDTGLDGTFAATPVSAGKNYWGGNVSPTTGTPGPSLGPLQPGGNSALLFGNPVTANVSLGATPVSLAGPTPVFGRATLGSYLTSINTVAPTIAPVASTVTSGAVQFTVSFPTPVRPQSFGPDGFTAADLQITDPNGATVPASQVVVTPVGAEPTAQYLVTVNGLTGFGNVTAAVLSGTSGPPNPVVFTPEGFRDVASNTAIVSFGTTPVTPPPPVTPPVTPPPERLVGSSLFAVGTDAGVPTVVRVFNADNTERFSFNPFPGFTGGVRVAVADFNGDGIGDIVVGTGPGVNPIVEVRNGTDASVLFTIRPFESRFTGGVFVAAGDITGDGRADLVITPDVTGGPRARIFSGDGFGQIADFFGIEDPNFRGGARCAIGDINGDGVGDLLFAAGFGGGPRVAGFDGVGIGSDQTRRKLFADFFVFEQSLRNGVFPAAGDINGDGFADVVAGAGPGGGPRVFVLSGRDIINNNQTQLANFFGGDPPNRGGIRVAVKNLDGDAFGDIVTGPGTSVPTAIDPVPQGFGTRVTEYAGKTIPIDGTPDELARFDAFPGFAGGIFVG